MTSVAVLNPQDAPVGYIRVLPPFTVVDSEGRAHAIAGAFISSAGYIPDIHVRFDTKAPSFDRDKAPYLDLWDDQKVIDAVLEKLRVHGYEGPNFGRAELGMQGGANAVVLEPGSAFNKHAAKLGWTYLGNEEEDLCSELLHMLPAHDFVNFECEDGRIMGLPIRAVAEHRARAHSSDFGDVVSRSLAQDTVPLFLRSREAALEWAERKMRFQDVKDKLVVIVPAREPDLSRAWSNARKTVKSLDLISKDAASRVRGSGQPPSDRRPRIRP